LAVPDQQCSAISVAVGLVHALILRLQALMLPFKTLVFREH
jgi:hypothetical protein